MTKLILIFAAGIFILFVCYQYFYGGSSDDIHPRDRFEVVAHRGVHQNYNPENIDWRNTCTATRIYEPTQHYLENTIESVDAAFEMGDTIIEIDINRTSDNHIVLFHDWMLECRTNGKGKISDFPLAYLKTLDVGYGYTYDGGKTFPFRGKGIGKIPTLVEVLNQYPNKKFLIDHKDGSMKTARLLAEIIKNLPGEQQKLIYYWGPEATFQYIKKEIPTMSRLFCNKRKMKKWLYRYLLTFGLMGWSEASRG